MVKDSLGREWQVATIQLDMVQPERFDLYCIDENGQHERVVMIHAAIMGSIDRFLSILIEHTAGAFPLWLSPVQVSILPISEKQNEYAELVKQQLLEKLPDLRTEIDNRDESVGKKIRESELQKTPFMLVVGEKELNQHEVAVRTRGNKDLGTMSIEKISKLLKETIENKK